MKSAAALRYARALLEVALEHAGELKPDDVITQLRAVEDLMAASADLRHVLLTPAVANSRKRAVLGRLAAPLGLSPLLRNFLFVVTDHQRLDQISRIREAFEEFLDEERGFVRASIVTAQPLDEGESRRVESRLERLTGKRIRAQYRIDEALIGGVLARIGSTVYDGSVHGQLQTIRDKLAAGAGI